MDKFREKNREPEGFTLFEEEEEFSSENSEKGHRESQEGAKGIQGTQGIQGIQGIQGREPFVVIPWKDIIIDPLGNEREIVINCEVEIEDIWKWQKFYKEYQSEMPIGKFGKFGKRGKRGDKEESRNEKKGGSKIGISKRLTTIEKCTDSAKKEKCISNLVVSLKTFTGDSLSELVLHNLDRLREVSKVPCAAKRDKEFLNKILAEQVN